MEAQFFRSFVEGRKGEILDAALHIFREKGYANGSMRDIAQLVGITEPALYRHFKGKEDLFLQLIEKAGERLLSEATQLLDEVDPEKIKLSLENIFHDRQKAIQSYFPFMKTIMLECFHNQKFMETFKISLAVPIIKKLHRIIPLIDAYYGQFHSPEEISKRIRVFLSIFMGYFVTSIFIKENDNNAITNALIKIMDWYGEEGVDYV